jgi:serine/threonine protein kinase
LHSKGISHRDLKPENFLLERSMRLVIADFGCATMSKSEITKSPELDSSIIVGSHDYNPPEYNMEKTYIGEKFDIFSLGVWAFLMVFGSAPFRKASYDDEYFKLFAKDKQTYWGIYSTVQCSQEFRDFFERMCEPNPEKRITLNDIKTHPWILGPMYSKSEFEEAMQDRIELTFNVSRREIQEKFENHKQEIYKLEMHSQMESGFYDKILSSYLPEADNINSVLEKRRKEILEEVQIHNSSDDQANNSIEEAAKDKEDYSKEELKSPEATNIDEKHK